MTGLAGTAARAGAVDLRIRDGVIAEMGRLEKQPGEAVIDASGCVVYPAWVNTHHHLAQTLMKGTPEGLNTALREWLREVPSRYRRFVDEDAFRVAARLGMIELHAVRAARPSPITTTSTTRTCRSTPARSCSRKPSASACASCFAAAA